MVILGIFRQEQGSKMRYIYLYISNITTVSPKLELGQTTPPESDLDHTATATADKATTAPPSPPALFGHHHLFELEVGAERATGDGGGCPLAAQV